MKDYKNTILYKLVSLNPLIKEIYIGHTTLTLHERFTIHKHNSKCNSSKLYSFINDHGGIKKWKAEIIENYPCSTLVEAKDRECQLINKYHSALNSNIPNQSYKQWRIKNKERYNEYMKNYMRDYKKKLIKT